MEKIENQDTPSEQDNNTETDVVNNPADPTDVNNTQVSPADLSFLPQEYREDKSFNTYKDLPSILKTFKEQQKMLGRSLTFVPDEKSTQKQWDSFYSKIGRPENRDGYQVEETKLPEGYKRSEEFLAEYKEKAYELGLRPDQFKKLFNWVEGKNIEYFNKNSQQMLEEKKQFEEVVSKTFGDRKDIVLENARKIARDNLSPDLSETLLNVTNEQFIAIASLLDNFSKKYMEQDQIGNIKTGVTSEEAKKQEAIQIGNKLKGMSLFDPEYQKLFKRKVELMGQIGKPVVNWYDESPKK